MDEWLTAILITGPLHFLQSCITCTTGLLKLSLGLVARLVAVSKPMWPTYLLSMVIATSTYAKQVAHAQGSPPDTPSRFE